MHQNAFYAILYLLALAPPALCLSYTRSALAKCLRRTFYRSLIGFQVSTGHCRERYAGISPSLILYDSIECRYASVLAEVLALDGSFASLEAA